MRPEHTKNNLPQAARKTRGTAAYKSRFANAFKKDANFEKFVKIPDKALPCEATYAPKQVQTGEMQGVYRLLEVRQVSKTVIALWFATDILISVLINGWFFRTPFFTGLTEKLPVPSELVVNLASLAIELGLVLLLARVPWRSVRRDRWQPTNGLSFALCCFNILLFAYMLSPEIQVVLRSYALEGWQKILSDGTTLFFGVAVAEEIIFRWFLLGQFYRHAPKHYSKDLQLAFAILLSQGLFALAHLPVQLLTWNANLLDLPLRLYGLFAYGLIFSLVYVRTRSLWAAIFVHTIVDWVAILPMESLVLRGTVLATVMIVLLLWPRIPNGTSAFGLNEWRKLVAGTGAGVA